MWPRLRALTHVFSLLIAILALVHVVQPSPSLAQDNSLIEKFYVERLVGWKFVAIRCIGEEGVSWQEEACKFIEPDLSLILAQNSIEGSYCPNCSTYKFFRGLYNNGHVESANILELQIEFMSTKDGTGGIVRLSAGRSYDNVVDPKATPNTAMAMPRGGTLELWSGYAAYSGPSITAPEVAPYILSLTKQFLVYYTKAMHPK